MQYRLTEDLHDAGLIYGWLTDETILDKVSYHERCLFEPVVSIDDYDTIITHYKDGVPIDGFRFGFFSNEKQEIKKSQVQSTCTILRKPY